MSAGLSATNACAITSDARRSKSLIGSAVIHLGNSLAAAVPGGISSAKYNNVIYSTFAGINPTPKLNLEANLIYATVAEKALSKTAGVVRNSDSDKLGWEVDLKATYKIYDNLTYMVGAGYLWTGDYFKGTNSAQQIDNNYLLMNQLTLSF